MAGTNCIFHSSFSILHYPFFLFCSAFHTCRCFEPCISLKFGIYDIMTWTSDAFTYLYLFSWFSFFIVKYKVNNLGMASVPYSTIENTANQKAVFHSSFTWCTFHWILYMFVFSMLWDIESITWVWKYGIYLWMFNDIEWAQQTSEISTLNTQRQILFSKTLCFKTMEFYCEKCHTCKVYILIHEKYCIFIVCNLSLVFSWSTQCI